MARMLLELTSPLELKIIDMTVRMFTEPTLKLDEYKLYEYYEAEKQRKEDLLNSTAASKEVLMSNDKLAEALADLGVIPPTKISKRTGNRAFAFAKSDKEFTALLDHPNSDVQALVAARLGVKTTIAETRAQRLIDTALRGRGFPIYLNYWGAKTTGRMSGGNGINAQNIPNRGPDRAIREAIIAPPGHKIVVGDSSNIELRVAMAAAGQDEVVDKLRDGVDLYCDFASKLYGREITKKDGNERMLGKIAMLSLQYGAGANTFREMVRVQAKKNISPEEAQQIVDLYRSVHGKVAKLWRHCQDNVLEDIYNDQYLTAVDVNGWALTMRDGYGVPGLPGIYYYGLRKDTMNNEWLYTSGKTETKIYGGKVVENLCQHLARHIVLWQTARVNERYPVALSVHDEIVCVVPDEDVDDCVEYMTESLSLAPKWCRGQIPLDCEVGVGISYGTAK
jgi:DNA polymerase